ncbi:MAG TPA: Na+/H+ antiporter subunit E [bacterium]|nr:Na+/H+ antiporter subunit E [bacterium]
MARIPLLILGFLFWLLLTWPFTPDGGVDGLALLVGLTAVLMAVLLFGQPGSAGGLRWLDPRRWFWGCWYVLYCTVQIVHANLGVMYRVLMPRLRLRPGIVRARTRLQSPVARLILASAISLTPGTLTMDIRDDGTMYIHCLFIGPGDVEAQARQIVARHEALLLKVLA